MGPPLIDQGILNRIKAAVTWTNFPDLNVTAPFLDKEGITLRLDGQASMQHDTMTGLVQSPEPYLAVSVVIALLRTQPHSDAYKTQMAGLSPYQLQNMSIQSVGDLLLNGSTPIYGVTCRGFYVVNNNLFN